MRTNNRLQKVIGFMAALVVHIVPPNRMYRQVVPEWNGRLSKSHSMSVFQALFHLMLTVMSDYMGSCEYCYQSPELL